MRFAVSLRLLRAFSILALTSMLAACSGMDAANEYSGISPVDFAWDGNDWRIFDKSSEGRLMITPSVGNAIGTGIIQGLTLGTADRDIPKSRYQKVIMAWWVQNNRTCKVTDGYKLISVQWEFTYTCP